MRGKCGRFVICPAGPGRACPPAAARPPPVSHWATVRGWRHANRVAGRERGRGRRRRPGGGGRAAPRLGAADRTRGPDAAICPPERASAGRSAGRARRPRAGRQSTGGDRRAVSLSANSAAGGGGRAAPRLAAADRTRGQEAAICPPGRGSARRASGPVRASARRRPGPGGGARAEPRLCGQDSGPGGRDVSARARLGALARANDGREAPHQPVECLPSVGGAATGGAATRRSARDGGRPAGRRRARGAGAPRRCPTRVRRR